jgi:hypothetical protein
MPNVKKIKFSNLTKNLNVKTNSLNIQIDENTILVISAAELFATVSSIITNTQKSERIPLSVSKAIQQGITPKRTVPKKVPRKKVTAKKSVKKKVNKKPKKNKKRTPKTRNAF